MLKHETVGLGLRREFLDEFKETENSNVQYLEVAPENWMDMGGKRAKELHWFREKYPIVAHGLSLSLGGTDPLDIEFIKSIKNFITQYDIALYTEHISFTGAKGILYDLLPLPFNQETINNLVDRIQKTQDILGQKIAIENASYYAHSPLSEMTEYEFISQILKKADCNLQLDINNVFVNSINFKFNAYEFLDNIPKDKVVYMHVAGHDEENNELLIDTHGQDVRLEVWDLLKYSYNLFGIVPTTLERDLNVPSLAEVLQEVDKIKQYQTIS